MISTKTFIHAFRKIQLFIDAHIGSLPATDQAHTMHNPYRVLVFTIISLRTKDTVSVPAAQRLIKKAPTLKKLALLSHTDIANTIYPAGFYNTKSKQLKKIADILLRDYDGTVPSSREELLALPGVGKKTANLVLSVGFGIPAICVDIHVHRICNRLGYVQTKTPDETETVLNKKLPEKYWIIINDYFVRFGQETCRPVSPYCSLCPIRRQCSRVGIERSR